MAHRAGFVIPNATDAVASNRQAEPDAGDFSILGNDNYGVLTGFNFNILPGSGTFLISSAVNSCVINGEIYTAPETPALSYELNGGGTNARFDLVVYDPLDGAKLALLDGAEENLRPKFRDIDSGVLPIAAIYIPARSANTDLTMLHVVDKRKWLLNGARGAVGLPNTFLENRVGGTDQTFKVIGSGQTVIGSSTGPHVTLKPYDASGPKFDIIGEANGSGALTEVLFKTPKVSIQGSLAVQGNVTASGMVTGSNLYSGNLTGTPPDVGHTGSIYQDTTNGRIYVRMKAYNAVDETHWAEIAADEYPVGTIIPSLLSSTFAAEFLSGSWLLLDGTLIVNGALTYPNLARAFKDEGWVRGDDLQLPNYTDCFLGSAGVQNVGKKFGTNDLHLTQAQLPAHRHFGSGTSVVQTSEAGGHAHAARSVTGQDGRHSHTMGLTGQHLHQIHDPLHVHIGADHGLQTFANYIAQMWGGTMLLDMKPGDAGHGTTVDITNRTLPAYTGINSTQNDGLHSHPIDFDNGHTHPLNLAPENPHRHTLPVEDPIGTSSVIDNRPKFVSVNWYVKA